jgi:hypothetical protein
MEDLKIAMGTANGAADRLIALDETGNVISGRPFSELAAMMTVLPCG